ncbi:L-2-hydroxyglutarate oxidase [Roseisolibacter agri]|uniref:Hydroxyglutarate oxidase n=1 Tax=Roseisolibacter agri TaxID=2014610 RepID=A0AA37QKJ5_9BACT|nr:L-2-hydroxyglutarate oxidase [Roseisolibacter agri]GLC27503.1 hydroxyglutarate oxidase [Roseisolibacter agri]
MTSIRPSDDASLPARGSAVIVGAGLVGLATALKLARARPDVRVTVLEKEARVAEHQSTHNSGVLHAGLYYAPGSRKARLATDGIRQMTAFCREQGVRHEICGKVVVAVDDTEVPRLRTLLERGTANGLQGLRWLSGAELREIEPHAAGVAAVHVPEEGIADYRGVADALVRVLAAEGVDVRTGAGVRSLARRDGGWRIGTDAGEHTADLLVNCAGLHCDRIARMAGAAPALRIVPFRGEYFELRPERASLVRHLVYPVPDPSFPFLGVHFTRMIGGGVECGPNAVLAFKREGYRKRDVSPTDLADALTFRGLWRFMARYPGMTMSELKRSFSRRLFAASLQRLVPEVREADLMPGGAGVRAQAMAPDGSLVQDFAFVRSEGALHVLNAPSPAATASLAIGDEIVRELGISAYAAR